jgi:hypothetical protein
MKRQKGFNLFELLLALFWMVAIVAWPFNLYRLATCDFESPYKCEVIHAIGVAIPPAAIVTAWFPGGE